MTGDWTIDPTPTAKPAPFQTNEQIVAAFRHHLRGLAENTQSRADIQVQAFLRRLPSGMLATQVLPHHLKQYLDRYSSGCRYFARRLGASGPGCRKGADMTNCGESCPLYERILQGTMDGHVGSINALYSFLAYTGHIQTNFVPSVTKEWHREFGSLDTPDPCVYRPKIDAVRALINGTEAPNRRMLYAAQAKHGLRIHEAVGLRVDEPFLDLDAGWTTVPPGGKRKGNPDLFIDRELARVYDEYLEWRARSIRTETNILLLNAKGLPLAQEKHDTINQYVLRPDAVRLGLQRPDAPRGQRWHTHSFRHFFSDFLEEQGCPTLWWHVLRGDKVRGTEGRYVKTRDRERIRKHYLQFAPVIGIN